MDKFMVGMGMGVFITSAVFMRSNWETWILPILGAVLIIFGYLVQIKEGIVTIRRPNRPTSRKACT
jgi:hypothetical protein